MITLVHFALDSASRADREAFILHTMEGFSVDEIAAITDRKPGEISTSIAAVREHLRRSPPLASRGKDKFVEHPGTD
jgi:DNA-directed RNA polymerase specialized sigma24 family protein